MRGPRNVILVSSLACVLMTGCENAETRARYVKAPLDGVDLRDRTSLNQAVNEARTRLASVRGDRLRTDLSRDIDEVYDRALEQIQEVERREAEAQQAAREAEAERQRVAAAIEEERRLAVERKYEEAERHRATERKEPERPERTGAEEQAERRRAAIERQLESAKEGVTELEVSVRDSALGDGTRVLVLRNTNPYPVSFSLRCFTRGDTTQKTFFMQMPAGGERRIGFVQGWNGNFRGGERCEAYVDRELMWSYTVPDF